MNTFTGIIDRVVIRMGEQKLSVNDLKMLDEIRQRGER